MHVCSNFSNFKFEVDGTTNYKDAADAKKIRRRLPPIPPGVEPVTTTKQRSKSASPLGRSYSQPDMKIPKLERSNSREAERKRTATDRDRPTSAPKRPLATSPATRKTVSEESKTVKSKPVSKSIDGLNTIDVSNEQKRREIQKQVDELKAKKKASSGDTSPSITRVYNIEVPSEIRSLKQRLKEELQITTASRRLQIDELEELRKMEKRLEEMEKERKRSLERKYIPKTKPMMKDASTGDSMERILSPEKPEQKKQEARRRVTPPATTMTSRTSPHTSPRRIRHKRQNSDPVISKFSPIEEARDFENELQETVSTNTQTEDLDAILDNSAFKPVRRVGTITPPKIDASQQTDRSPESKQLSPSKSLDHSYEREMGFQSSKPPLSKSSELLSGRNLETSPRLSLSQSELASGAASKAPMFYLSEEDERRRKEERREQLRIEIDKRKRQIEYEQRQQVVGPSVLSNVHMGPYSPSQKPITPTSKSDKVPTGIIRPLDDFEPIELEQDLDVTKRTRAFPHTNYSSSEYIAHKIVDRPERRMDGQDALVQKREAPEKREYVNLDYTDGRLVSPHLHYGKTESKSAEAESSPASGTSSQIHYSAASKIDQRAHSDDRSDTTSKTPVSDVASSPPAMPILDDVTKRSRSLLRDIGSRPLSDDMDKYFQAEGSNFLNSYVGIENSHRGEFQNYRINII